MQFLCFLTDGAKRSQGNKHPFLLIFLDHFAVGDAVYILTHTVPVVRVSAVCHKIALAKNLENGFRYEVGPNGGLLGTIYGTPIGTVTS